MTWGNVYIISRKIVRNIYFRFSSKSSSGNSASTAYRIYKLIKMILWKHTKNIFAKFIRKIFSIFFKIRQGNAASTAYKLYKLIEMTLGNRENIFRKIVRKIYFRFCSKSGRGMRHQLHTKSINLSNSGQEMWIFFREKNRQKIVFCRIHTEWRVTPHPIKF